MDCGIPLLEKAVVRIKIVIVALVIGMVWKEEQGPDNADSNVPAQTFLIAVQGESKQERQVALAK